MATYERESVITSYSAVKYDPETETTTAYTPNAKGEIVVEENDIVRFYHYYADKRCSLASLAVYAITNDMKVQINQNSDNPIYVIAGNGKSIDGMQIDHIKFLTAGTVYYEGLTLSPLTLV